MWLVFFSKQMPSWLIPESVTEVRTDRYITVKFSNFNSWGKNIYLSWTATNGIPKSCFILTAEVVEEEWYLSFKTNGKGWVEVEIPQEGEPVQFDLRFVENKDCKKHGKRGGSKSSITLQFKLIDKDGSKLETIATASLEVVPKCTKNHGTEISGELQYVNDTSQSEKDCVKKRAFKRRSEQSLCKSEKIPKTFTSHSIEDILTPNLPSEVTPIEESDQLDFWDSFDIIDIGKDTLGFFPLDLSLTTFGEISHE